jgi:hypothetical protein
MPSHYYEKPKDWNVAPESSWVSGTPIGQSDIKMPDLGDPGAHENASDKVSFEDSGSKQPALDQGRPVSQCPPGKSAQAGICMPDPKSEASLESKIEASTKGGKQWNKDEEGSEKPQARENSFKRELPKTPAEADPQIRRLAKHGYKGRGK